MTRKILTALVALAPLVAPAKDLFTVTTTGGATLTVSGSRLADMLEDAVKAQGDFAAIGSGSARISVNYTGQVDAIVMDVVDPALPGNPFTATLTLTGFSKTFSGATKDELQDAIEDFIREEGAGRNELFKALKRVWAKSPVTITDGTPHASTAMIANRAFAEFGLRHGKTGGERALLDAGKPLDTGFFGIEVDAGRFETEGGYRGESYTVAPTLRLGERWGFVLSAPVRYLDIEGAQAAEWSLLAGIPLQILSEDKDSRLFWQVTPHAHAALAGSLDVAQAGLEVGGGLTHRIGYDFGWGTLQLANQFGHFEGLDIDGVDTGVKQQILKNGLQLSVPLASRWLVEARAVRTDFLKDAPMDAYYTFGADLVFRSPGESSWAMCLVPDDFYVGAYVDMDFDDYTSAYARAGIRWKW